MGDYENDELPKPTRVHELYNAPAATGLVKAVLPKSTADVLQRLTGAPIRTVTRWIKGESRIPPRLLDKLRIQKGLKKDFDRDLDALLAEHADRGLLRAVLRQSLLEQVNGEFLEIDEEI